MGKKRSKKRLTREEKRRLKIYYLMLSIPLILGIIIINCYGYILFSLVSRFSDTEVFYVELSTSVFLILCSLFIIASIVLWGSLLSSLTRPIANFKDFISEKNHKNLITIIFLLAAVFLSIFSAAFMNSYRVVADEEGYKNCYLIKDDELVFDYDSVENVEMYVIFRYGISRYEPRGGYELEIDITANGEMYSLHADSFSNDFENMYNLLSKIDKDKITFDTTDVEHAFKSNAEQDKYLQMMIDEYS